MKTLIIFFFSIHAMLFSANSVLRQTGSISTQISMQLNDKSKRLDLHFPKSVKRYYDQNGLQLAWISRNQDKQTGEAMMLLDCVLHYGLIHADYHPQALIYDNLSTMINEPEKIAVEQRVRFDILLTDAIITLINNLHYGKLSPNFPAKKIDRIRNTSGFNAVTELTKANKGNDFRAAILTAQPNSKAYGDLQSYMRLVKGQYVGDCYEVPESEVRKIAINMERLRWWAFGKMTAYQKKAAYQTCEIKDGLPVFYPDPRQLDLPLEAALYSMPEPLPSKM